MIASTVRPDSVEHAIEPPAPSEPSHLDEESREWLRELRSDGEARQRALARLHELLVRAARFVER